MCSLSYGVAVIPIEQTTLAVSVGLTWDAKPAAPFVDGAGDAAVGRRQVNLVYPVIQGSVELLFLWLLDVAFGLLANNG